MGIVQGWHGAIDLGLGRWLGGYVGLTQAKGECVGASSWHHTGVRCVYASQHCYVSPAPELKVRSTTCPEALLAPRKLQCTPYMPIQRPAKFQKLSQGDTTPTCTAFVCPHDA
jgi:hypothetical protein